MDQELLDRIRAAVRRTCPAWMRDQAEDIAQAVALGLVRRGQLDGSGEGNRPVASTYLTKAAHGLLVDEIRRRHRRPETPLEARPEGDDMTAGAPGPEAGVRSREIARGIRDCLATLVAPRRRAATLHLLGCSVPETARRCGWNPKRAENLVYRGLADLRRCLRGKGLTP